MNSKLDVLVLFDSAGTPPADQDFTKELKSEHEDWLTEIDVIDTLKRLGHNVRILGVYDDAGLIVDEIKKNKPHVVFNLTEIFLGKAHFDKNVVALLEMLDIPYTGCGPEGLTVCNDKSMSKKILTFHRIKVPRFHVFRKGKRVWHPKRIKFPALIKPLREHASTGIAQASYVENESDFCNRIKFIQENLNMHAIAEEYIDGRELYASVLGDQRLKVFPLREVKFTEIPDDEPKIATYKAKWDEKYRERWGIKNVFAGRLPNGIDKKIATICKRAYRVLRIQGYGRFDLRLTPQNDVFILEANPNPILRKDEDFAQSAEKGGLLYKDLINKVLQLALRRVVA
jgi:D-alanine-D-alanine ligase